jgi:hypothetical protein
LLQGKGDLLFSILRLQHEKNLFRVVY